MNFTKEEFETLSKYESNMHTAYYSDYSRNVMRKDLEIIVGIFSRVLGYQYSMNYSCGACQLSLLKKVGKRYFEDKAEYAKQAYEEPEPGLSIKKLWKRATSTEQKGEQNKEEKSKKRNGKNNKGKVTEK